MMADSKLVDHRKALRRRILKAGVIGFGGGGINPPSAIFQALERRLRLKVRSVFRRASFCLLKQNVRSEPGGWFGERRNESV